MTTDDSLHESYFNDVYKNRDDPWDFETSEYERKKYAATVAALTQERYNNAFEIGCSIGVLSVLLAARCNKLLSVDVSEKPLEKARRRLHDYPQVAIKKMTVPEQFPQDRFDLVVLSEVGYYWSEGRSAPGAAIDHRTPGASRPAAAGALDAFRARLSAHRRPGA